MIQKTDCEYPPIWSTGLDTIPHKGTTNLSHSQDQDRVHGARLPPQDTTPSIGNSSTMVAIERALVGNSMIQY